MVILIIHHILVNCPYSMYNYIRNGMMGPLYEPINIDFKYTDHENKERKQRRCKISIDNRICHLLNALGEGEKILSQACKFG